MNLDPITLAIPLFFLLIGLELLIQWWSGEPIYRANDAMANISCGIVDQAMGTFSKVLTVGLYQVTYQSFAPWTIPNNWFTFLLLIIAVDFFYYWGHRKSHEINLFWGGHVVHHQSEDYNLSVALRQGSFQTFWVSLFYLPLALVGFDTYAFLAASSLVTLYQFWIHTEKIGKLGYLEWIFNTPSHHRVHHGTNEKYIDRNHAGMLIIWDRMFGTFQEEEERPTYGITGPLQSWNPVWANLNHYSLLYGQVRQARSWKERFGYLFRGPGWTPEGVLPPKPTEGRKKYDSATPRVLIRYLLFQYATIILYTATLLLFGGSLSSAVKVFLMVFVIGSTVSIAALAEGRRWAVVAEVARVLIVGGLFASAISFTGWLIAGVCLTTLYVMGSLLWLRKAIPTTQAKMA